MRLNKYLAENGVASRRQADELIKQGKVRVNNVIISQMGVKIDPEKDEVAFLGKKIEPVKTDVTYIFNKPKGVVTTADDPEGRKTVMDYMPKEPRVYPCGRLDVDTMGLVILTNNGDLCFQLTHPKFEHEKEYVVEGTSHSIEAAIKILQQGVVLPDGPVTIHQLKILKRSGKKIKFSLVIHEGRNRLVRRMCAKAGIEVTNLTRIRVSKYELGDLAPGEYRIWEERHKAPL